MGAAAGKSVGRCSRLSRRGPTASWRRCSSLVKSALASSGRAVGEARRTSSAPYLSATTNPWMMASMSVDSATAWLARLVMVSWTR